MFVNPITILPHPFPIMPSPVDPGGKNGGVVPPWLQRDLGYEATHATIKGHEGWRLII